MSFELHKHAKTHHQNNIDKFKMLHKRKYVQIIDRWVMIIGILSPLTSLPQVLEILNNKNADGVSAATWLLYIVLALFWVIYGIAHKEKVIIANNVAWIILEAAVVILTIIY